MANPKIEVEIGAVIDGLRKGFGESVKIIETLEKQALDLDKALRAATDLPTIQNLNSQLAQTKSALSQLKNSGIDPLTKATSNYNSVGVDFARIIQDAPFGIIGVGNNITQLASSFQVLKNSTGSTKAALTQAFSSIFSSGNALILGISLLTTAFTILQQQGFFKTEDAAKSLADQLDEYKKTLNETTQAQLEGAASADKEIVKINALRTVIENETLTREKRLAAVKQLKEEAPSIFKNLSDEQILAGQVGDSYARLTQILIARATAASGINKIVALADEERIILEKNAETLAKIADFEEKAVKNRNAGQKELAIINENQVRFLKEQNPEIQRLVAIEAERVKLTGLVNNNLAQSVDYSDKSVKSTDANKLALDRYKDSWDEFNLAQESANLLAQKFSLTQDELGKKIQQVFAEVKPVEVKIKTDVVLDEDIPDQLPFIDRLLESLNPKRFTEFEERTAQFATTMLSILDSGLGNAFVDLGQSIGEALATGGNVLASVGKSLLGSVGKLLGDFGKQLIAFGVAGLAYSSLIKSLFTDPVTAAPKAGLAIAAGVALVALSGAISSGLKSNSGGGGGGGGGSSVGSSGVGGGSSFVGAGAQGGMFAANKDLNGELVVRGQDLVYVFGQANNRINKG